MNFGIGSVAAVTRLAALLYLRLLSKLLRCRVFPPCASCRLVHRNERQPVSSPCATALRVLVGPWGARQDSPISLDTLPVKLVYRHHRKASARTLVGPAGSHAIAAFEHIENFKVPFMG